MKKILSICNSIKEKTTKIFSSAKKNAIALYTSALSATALTGIIDVYAVNEGALMKQVLGIIFKIFRYIGILLFAWSVGMLVLAFKNEDADSKSRAMMMMVVSVILVAIEPIITATGILNEI